MSIRGRFLDRESLYNDIAEMCIAILLTYAVAGNLFLAPAALPVITLLQRSLRHAQLVIDARADAKTGLLNAATWEREAAAEVARAVRTTRRSRSRCSTSTGSRSSTTPTATWSGTRCSRRSPAR